MIVLSARQEEFVASYVTGAIGIDDERQVRILGIDLEKNVLDVTMDPHLVEVRHSMHECDGPVRILGNSSTILLLNQCVLNVTD